MSLSLILLIFFALVDPVSAQNRIDWEGKYVFKEIGSDEKANRITYENFLRLHLDDSGKLRAHFFVLGSGVQKELYASTQAEGNKLLILFEENGPDHKHTKHEKGDLLLTLQKREGRLKTEWGKLLPVFQRHNKGGFGQFEKTEESPDLKAEKWIELELEKGKLRIPLPDQTYFDTRSRGEFVTSAWGNIGDLRFDMVVFKGRWDGAKKRFRRSIKKGSTHIFDRDRYMIASYPLSMSGGKFSKSITILSVKYGYRFNFDGPLEAASIVHDLLTSIRFKEKTLFESSPTISATRIAKIKELKTSPEFELFSNPKNEETRRRVTNALNFDETKIPVDDSDLKAVVHTLDLPKKYYEYDVVTWMELRSDGRIGDLKFISSLDNKLLDRFVKSALKTRFIPAKKDGKFVTTWFRWNWRAKFLRITFRRTDFL